MNNNTAKILKALRKNANNTQKEVAEFLGISRQAYSRYESSLREPDMQTLAKIAKYFDVSPQVFYIDDIDKVIDSEMDIVEMIARYQVKKAIHKKPTAEEESALGKYIEKQDIEKIQSTLSEELGLEATSYVPISKKKKRLIYYPFYFLIILFAVNIGIMTLHRFDENYQYNILDFSYVNAVTPDQNVNQTMFLDIVRINEFNPDTIAVGDQIVIYSDFGLTEYFVEEVTSIDYTNETISSTYDDATVITNSFDDVTGTYVQEASLFGTIYYASKFSAGYVFLILGHIILLAMYYLSFIDTRR